MQDYTIDDWFYTVNSCLTSAYLCSRFAVPAMIAAGRGAIVNIASMAGRRGLPYRVGYCSAKAGQIGMTYGLALELGRHNITVNAIAPGAVAGDRIDRVIQGQAEVRGVERRAACGKSFVERSPLRRMSTAEDIAVARRLPLQRPRAQHLGPVHSGDRGGAGVVKSVIGRSRIERDGDRGIVHEAIAHTEYNYQTSRHESCPLQSVRPARVARRRGDPVAGAGAGRGR